jgi:selenocysteine lyase/cysteine desulfurase
VQGALYIVDACQAVGQLPVDVGAIGCDALTATGRKWLRGPRGTGLLWVHEDVVPLCTPIGLDADNATLRGPDDVRVVGDARRFQEFEMSIAGLVGLAAALRHLREVGIDAIHARVTSLAERLRAELSRRQGVSVHDGSGARSGIVTFTVEDHDPAAIVRAAAAAGITISVSTAPWAPLDLPAKRIESLVRVSPHVYNTDDELDRLLDVVDRLSR